jgi:hypothetical protein
MSRYYDDDDPDYDDKYDGWSGMGQLGLIAPNLPAPSFRSSYQPPTASSASKNPKAVLLGKGVGQVKYQSPGLFMHVQNPNNPNELIVVPAVDDGTGNLVPAPAGSQSQGDAGQLGQERPVAKPASGLLIGGAIAAVVVLALLSKGRR